MEEIQEKYQMLTIAIFNMISNKNKEFRDIEAEEAEINLQKLKREVEKYWKEKSKQKE